jgi:hypothetical protein
MSNEAHCPNCGCSFELSPDDVAAIVAASAPQRPSEDGPKSTRFAFRPELVEQDGVQVVRIVPVSPQQRSRSSER